MAVDGAWVVRREGESSIIHVKGRTEAWRMTQAEARELLNELSHVVLMPPELARRAGLTNNTGGPNGLQIGTDQ